jgi:hypothetical protein
VQVEQAVGEEEQAREKAAIVIQRYVRSYGFMELWVYAGANAPPE